MERTVIENQTFDEERALYNLTHGTLKGCIFAGPADGESALKEARDVCLSGCSFSLRYPLWHVEKFSMEDSTMDEMTRAAIWYASDGMLKHCVLGGIKAVRECSRIVLEDCRVDSLEFGWKSSDISIRDSQINSEYIFLDSKNVSLDHVEMKGKYSFQYMENLTITDSVLDTKDAFWHSRNVTVKNSVVKGEYLAWFSRGLTLVNCTIIGTQPLCYCEDLKLVDCKMEGTDLAFEYSDVEAEVIGHVESIKNPRSGRILLDSVGAVIREHPVMECSGAVVLRKSLQEAEDGARG